MRTARKLIGANVILHLLRLLGFLVSAAMFVAFAVLNILSYFGMGVYNFFGVGFAAFLIVMTVFWSAPALFHMQFWVWKRYGRQTKRDFVKIMREDLFELYPYLPRWRWLGLLALGLAGNALINLLLLIVLDLSDKANHATLGSPYVTRLVSAYMMLFDFIPVLWFASMVNSQPQQDNVSRDK